MSLPPLYDEHIRRVASGATRAGETENQVSLTGDLSASALRDLIQGVEAMGGDVTLSNGVIVVRTSPDIVANGSGGGGGGGSASVIADVTLNADASSFSIPSLDFSSWFLVRIVAQLRAGAAGESAGDWIRAMIRFNDDAGANYLWALQSADGQFVKNGDVGFVNGIEGLHGSGTNFSSSYFGTNIYDLVRPGDSTMYKSVSYQGGTPFGTNVLACFGSGFWQNTSAITKITFASNDGSNFDAGSRVVVLGLAGA